MGKFFVVIRRVGALVAVIGVLAMAPLGKDARAQISYCAINPDLQQYLCFPTQRAAESYLQQDPAPVSCHGAFQQSGWQETSQLQYPATSVYRVENVPVGSPYAHSYTGYLGNGVIGCGNPSVGCATETALLQEIQTAVAPYPVSTSGAYKSPPHHWGGWTEYLPGGGVRVGVAADQRYYGDRAWSATNNMGGWLQWTSHQYCPDGYSGIVPSEASPFHTRPWPIICTCSALGFVNATRNDQHKDDCPAANPCHPSTGAKTEHEEDFRIGSHGFGRDYNSLRQLPSDARLGDGWSHSLDIRIRRIDASATTLYLENEENLLETFQWYETSGAVRRFASTNTPGQTIERDDTAGSGATKYVLRRSSGEMLTFDLKGRLTTIDYPASAESYAVQYCTTAGIDAGSCTIDTSLWRVVDARGRVFEFLYSAPQAAPPGSSVPAVKGRLASIRSAGVTLVSYEYDELGRLARTLRPAASGTATREYHYGEAAHVCKNADGSASTPCTASDFIYHLTGITDERGIRYSTFTYDRFGRATTSGHAGGVDLHKFSYINSTQTQVTFPLGDVRTYTYTAPSAEFRKIVAITGGPNPFSRTHDGSYRTVASTDADGTITTYAYNSRGLVTVRGDADPPTAPPLRKTETDWHATLPKPTERRTINATSVLEGKTAWTYNARGQVVTQSTIDPVTAATRTTTFAYCEAADVAAPGSTCPILGLPKTVDGARTDAADITTYTYRAADASNCVSQPALCTYRKGDLWMVTNALGHVTEYLAYDGSGRVTSLKDANTVVTDLEYHPRGWLAARKVRGPNAGVETDDAITTMSYSEVGLVTRVTQPDGAYLDYTYDDARRLTDVTDNAGNTIHYTLDAAGNRVKEETKDPTGTITRSLARQVDALGRINRQLRAPYADLADLNDPSAKKTTTTFDANSNVDTVTDPLGRVTDNDYDPLERLVKTISDYGTGKINATVQYQYDARDNLTRVTDPKGLHTDYTYNGLGDLTQLSSPDTGITTYTYDSAGNRATQTDARGITSTMSYDAANRLTGIAYPTTSENVAFYYDQIQAECTTGETFALGRMTRMTDESGETRYCYDRRGNPTRKVQVTDGVTLSVQYGYDLADRLASVTYPNGALVSYSRDPQGRIVGVTHTPGGGPARSVVSNVTYLPFGPIATITYGNGRTLTKTYDRNYAIDAIATSPANGINHDYTVDDVGNIVGIALTGSSTTRAYTYDNLDRLTSVKDQNNALLEAFTYDATGNRTSKQVGAGAAVAYSYPGTSHRLSQVGSTPRSYDANGNTTGDGANALAYDDRNRLASVAGTSYRHNGKGERVQKAATRFVFDEGGRLLSEHGAGVTTHIWMDDTVIATTSGTALSFVEADHLGTLRRVVEPGRDVAVWSWGIEGAAFGEGAPASDPDGDAISFSYALRYPGQQFDAESGLSYNYFRDYEPGTGRYVESDPVGLYGGLASYAYADSRPNQLTDPLGLLVEGSNADRCYGQPAWVCDALVRPPPPEACDYCVCLANCIRFNDPLNGTQTTALTTAGGTVPKSAVGLPRGLGGASPLTTGPSIAVHLAQKCFRIPRGVVAGARNFGRFFSPAFRGYGLGMFVVEVGCAAACSGDSNLY